MMTFAPTTQAVVPAPSGDSAVVSVKVGGIREGTAVTGLAGVTLQLHKGGRSNTVGDPITDPWATCVSDADGDCNFVIPDTAPGEANFDNRFYIKQADSSPTGWYENSTFSTSSRLTDPSYVMRTGLQLRDGRTYLSTRDFPLTNTGGRSSAGVWAESLDNPALPASCGINAALILDLSYSVASGDGGDSALPQLKAAATGLTDALVGTASQVGLFTFGRNAPASFPMNANRPLTPVSTQAGASQVEGWISGLAIPGTGGAVGGIGNAESTNWDQGLYQVAQQQNDAAGKLFDVAIIITDGDPTRYSEAMGNGYTTRFAEVEQAVFSANALKERGTRVIAIGVGDGVVDSAPNLRAISGPTSNTDYYTVGWNEAAETIKSLALAGCVAAPQTSSLNIVKQVVPADSNGDPDYTKAVPAAGWTVKPTTTTLGATFDKTSGVTAAGTGAVGFTLTIPSDQPTAEVTVTEDTTPIDPGDNTYTPVPSAIGSQAADCVLKSPTGGPDTPLALTDPNAAPGSFGVNLEPGQIASCTIYNQATIEPATIRVDKTWVINGTSYADGQQPTGFSSSYLIDQLEKASYPDLAWGVTYPGWQPGMIGTLTETVSLPASCTWTEKPGVITPDRPDGTDTISFTGVSLERTGPSGQPDIGTAYNLAKPSWPANPTWVGYNSSSVTTYKDKLEAGDNTWVVTNDVTCSPQLLLGKIVTGQPGVVFQTTPADPRDWNLKAIDLTDSTNPPLESPLLPECSPSQPTECNPPGSNSVGHQLVTAIPTHAYALAEAGPTTAPTYIQELHPNAAQPLPDDPNTPGDESRPMSLEPQATGSWNCATYAPSGTGDILPEGHTFGRITIPYDTRMIGCTTVNDTAEISATKTVVGGAATANQWTYSLTPVAANATDPAPNLSQATFGTATTPQAYKVLPMQKYTVSEDSGGPAGYTLTDVRCTWTAPQWGTDDPEPSWGAMIVHTDESILHPPAGTTPMELTLYAGTTASCEFINTADTHLTLVKEVDGGTSTPADWTLIGTGPTVITGKTGDTTVTNAVVTPGTYSLSETGSPTGTGTYTAAWTCVNADKTPVTITDGKVTLTTGADVTCTATNTWQAPPTHLTLVKTVVNGTGGTGVPTDWTLTGTGPTTITGKTGDTTVTNAVVTPGTYSLSETGSPTGTGTYTAAWTCVNADKTPVTITDGKVTLTTGADVTCTATNTWQAPPPPPDTHLTLVKTVINGTGGTGVPTDWTLTGTGPTTITGKTGDTTVTNAVVTPGTYSLSETGSPTGPGTYTAAWTCVNADKTPVTMHGTTVTLAVGDDITCTATNTWQAPPPPPDTHLTLVKTVVNGTGGTGKSTDWSLIATGPTSFTGITGTAQVTNVLVKPGDYTLTESGGPVAGTGTYTAAWTCVNADKTPVTLHGTTVTLAVGDDITCTATNTWQAPPTHLTLVKTVVNGTGGTAVASDWTLTGTGPTTITGKTGDTTVTNAVVTPGTYALTETGSPTGPGTYTGTWACVNADKTPVTITDGKVTLTTGADVTCTATNTWQAPPTPPEPPAPPTPPTPPKPPLVIKPPQVTRPGLPARPVVPTGGVIETRSAPDWIPGVAVTATLLGAGLIGWVLRRRKDGDPQA
jgi:hypothetical protein